MFERFTDRARRVVVLAQEESRVLGHDYIGTEHVLLGLVQEGGGVGAKALESLGVSLQAVRNEVETRVGRGESAPSGHIPFTPRAKKLLELALREAMALGHNYIGTEHILLGLLSEGEGVAAQVLNSLGADLLRVRAKVVELLSGQIADAGAVTRTVFVVSGRVDERRGEVARLVERLTGRSPVVLSEQPDDGRAIVEAFEDDPHPAVAVVILSGAHQHVVYQMGWFHGRLGRRAVVVLIEESAEAPSDLIGGVVSIPVDAEAVWRHRLGEALRACGVEVDLDNVD